MPLLPIRNSRMIAANLSPSLGTSCFVIYPQLNSYGCFPYIMENPIKMDDLGVPLFLETPILTPDVIFQLRKPPPVTTPIWRVGPFVHRSTVDFVLDILSIIHLHRRRLSSWIPARSLWIWTSAQGAERIFFRCAGGRCCLLLGVKRKRLPGSHPFPGGWSFQASHLIQDYQCLSSVVTFWDSRRVPRKFSLQNVGLEDENLLPSPTVRKTWHKIDEYFSKYLQCKLMADHLCIILLWVYTPFKFQWLKESVCLSTLTCGDHWGRYSVIQKKQSKTLDDPCL